MGGGLGGGEWGGGACNPQTTRRGGGGRTPVHGCPIKPARDDLQHLPQIDDERPLERLRKASGRAVQRANPSSV